MMLRLSKNSFVRQYGHFTYILNRISNYDQMFTDAEVFMRWITRTAKPVHEILGNICKVYAGADQRIIVKDFNEFIAPLIREKVILSGSSELEIAGKDESFSYDVDNPKTMDTYFFSPTADPDLAVPQDVLEKYFAEHPTIFDLQIDVTQACTERCVHCYIPEYNPVFLPFEKARKVIDEFRAQGGVGLSLSGGECMLHPDFERIVRYARERDLIVSILSNLTLCDETMVRLLVEAEVSVQVSLYSMNPTVHDAITRRVGSFKETKSAIERLRKAHVPCRISCPTMRMNYKDYLGVLEYARSLKMDAQTDFIIMGKQNCDTSNLSCRLTLAETRHVISDIVFKSVPAESEYFSIGKKQALLSDEEWAKRKVCGACISSVCLDASGNYYPCPAFGGVRLGNCGEHDLSWIWNHSPETLRIRNVKGEDFAKCVHCKDRDYCSICMCRNYNETGDMFRPVEHFCKVAAINHELVDEKHRQMIKVASTKKR